ncbi:mitochondrial large subunit ribosomal protein-domain-containing protein [Diaporthe sp. PMI_573]|nr:mitochondrial large subunit ribosomal protein-domain-containing protein [Diaporthaceae sp. PMI_573]
MLRQIPIRAATAAPSRLLFRPSFVASTRFLTTESAKASQSASAPPPSSPVPSTAAPTRQKQLSYLVERTPSKNLSVYNDARAGGTKKQTVVKKIVGDARALRDELVEELRFPRDDVKINPVTGHIKIKGFHAEKVHNWLEARGF